MTEAADSQLVLCSWLACSRLVPNAWSTSASDRNYSQDYVASMAKMLLLEATLSASGDSTAVARVTSWQCYESGGPKKKAASGKSCSVIKTFADSQDLENQYGLQQVTGNDNRAGPASRRQRPAAFQQIEHSFWHAARTRQTKMSLWKKTLWAGWDKKKSDGLLANLAFYVENPEKLSDRLQMLDLQQQILQTRLEQATAVPGIALLENAAAESDTTSASPYSRLGQDAAGYHAISCHHYIGTIVSDQA